MGFTDIFGPLAKRVECSQIYLISNFLLYILKIILSDVIYRYFRPIGLEGRVFPNGPGNLGSIPGRVIPKTQKKNATWYLLAYHSAL